MRAVLNVTVLAESDDTVVVEGNHYFPPDAVRWDHLRRSRLRTLCPWKGIATYHHAVLDDGEVANMAWTYRRPLPFARRIRGYVAFGGIHLGGPVLFRLLSKGGSLARVRVTAGDRSRLGRLASSAWVADRR